MNIGDYVRTKKDGIGKIIKTEPFMNTTHIFLDSKKGDITFQTRNGVFKVNNENSIIKSSPNIIDLIEVGDYVNGDRVKALKGDIESHKINNEDDVIYTEYINDYDEWCGFEEDEIKSIVTKEQFESMEYKIGDKENE